MQIIKDFSLKNHNTFGFDVKAAFYAQLQDVEQLHQLMDILPEYHDGFYILGGGSNVLFADHFPGLVVEINLKGKQEIARTQDHVWVKAMAGEDWDEFVDWCVGNNWGGLENLTMIPGRVGTSPMQNIGAYGVEIKDCFHQLEAWDLERGRKVCFDPDQCRFDYRDSFFKHEGRGKYIILSVSFRLSVKQHRLTLDYGPVGQQLQNISNPQLRDVVNAIRTIRESKLPDPKQLGNAGSFFKNPVIPKDLFAALKQHNPDMPFFDLGEAGMKIPAGWLIEKCGWKGKRIGDAGVHQQQALVLVNYGKARGKDILELSKAIERAVNEEFGVLLEREVNLVSPQTLSC